MLQTNFGSVSLHFLATTDIYVISAGLWFSANERVYLEFCRPKIDIKKVDPPLSELGLILLLNLTQFKRFSPNNICSFELQVFMNLSKNSCYTDGGRPIWLHPKF